MTILKPDPLVRDLWYNTDCLTNAADHTKPIMDSLMYNHKQSIVVNSSSDFVILDQFSCHFLD